MTAALLEKAEGVSPLRDQTGWGWSCPTCQESAVGLASRDKAREAYRQHVRTHVAADSVSEAAEQPAPSRAKKVRVPKVAKGSSTKQKKSRAKKVRAVAGGEPRRILLVSDAVAESILQRMRDDHTTLRTESQKLGHTHNENVRRALSRVLGGAAAYTKFIAEVRGARVAAKTEASAVTLAPKAVRRGSKRT